MAMGYSFDNSVEAYQRHVKEGRGQGCGDRYRPWFGGRDVPTRASTIRVPWSRRRRVCCFFSSGEVDQFLQLEWNDDVLDIQEQFPLDPQRTQQLAQQLSIRHPQVRGRLVVMTSDFVVTFRGTKIRQEAIQVKHCQDDAQQARTAQKLKLEKAYWNSLGIPWRLAISQNMNKVLCQNLRDLWPYRNAELPRSQLSSMMKTARLFLLASQPYQSLKQAVNGLSDPRAIIEIIYWLTAHKLLAPPLDKDLLMNLPVAEFGHVAQ